MPVRKGKKQVLQEPGKSKSSSVPGMTKGEEEFSRLVGQRFDDPEYSDVIIAASDGTEYHCSKFILRCGSDVFHKMFSHEMMEQISSTVLIGDAESGAIRQMLSFMHSGQCEMDSKSFLPLASLAQRYQVDHLINVCNAFEKEGFRVDETNCCVILEQSYSLAEAPQSVRATCETVFRQRVGAIFGDEELLSTFQELSCPAVTGILENALPEMFASENFPASYIALGEVLIAWLNHDSEARQKHAVDLFGLLEFESFGLEGIPSVVYPRGDLLKGENWVRSHPAIEKQALDALEVARTKPVHLSTLHAWKPPYSGRYTFVCRGTVNGPPQTISVVATFTLAHNDPVFVNFSSTGKASGCSVSVECSDERSNHHVLIAIGPIGGSVIYCEELFVDRYTYDWEEMTYRNWNSRGENAVNGRQEEQCSCRFSGTSKAEEVRQLFIQDPTNTSSWVSPMAEETFTVSEKCKNATVSIYPRRSV